MTISRQNIWNTFGNTFNSFVGNKAQN